MSRTHLWRDAKTPVDPDWGGMARLAPVIAVMCLGLVLSVADALAAPTKAQFIHRGDSLCRQVQTELAPLKRRAEAAASLPDRQKWAAATRLWTDQVRIQVRFNGRFHRLGVPSGDSRARSLVAGLDQGLVLARRVRDAFAAKSAFGLRTSLPDYIRFTLSLSRRVAAYGFKVCGSF